MGSHVQTTLHVWNLAFPYTDPASLWGEVTPDTTDQWEVEEDIMNFSTNGRTTPHGLYQSLRSTIQNATN